jgi:hypothetical protein
MMPIAPPSRYRWVVWALLLLVLLGGGAAAAYALGLFPH